MRLPTHRLLPLLGIVGLFWIQGWSASPLDNDPREASLVTLDITGKRFNIFQPWARGVKNIQKNAVVFGDRTLLTTADGLDHQTLIRARVRGRGAWYIAQLSWVDYHANLASITLDDSAFWDSTQPVELASPRETNFDELEIVRWRNGQFESRDAELDEILVQASKLSQAQHVQFRLNSEIDGAGWSEAVFDGVRLVGLTSSHEGNVSTVIPASFIQTILEGHQKENEPSLGYFHFVWQQGTNPEVNAFLGLPESRQGVVVIEAPPHPLTHEPSIFQPHDVILSIDGFEIDIQGDYQDPDYGYLMLENLATRQHWANTTIPIQVWRKGSVETLEYLIPPLSETGSIVPQHNFFQAPEYLISGGFIFQPLTATLLDSFGRRPPFRLKYYQNESASSEQPSLVVLSQVLPDPYNLGYQDVRMIVLKSINDLPIHQLKDIPKAFAASQGDFHILQFMEGANLQRIVLSSTGMNSATERVLQLYGIPWASSF